MAFQRKHRVHIGVLGVILLFVLAGSVYLSFDLFSRAAALKSLADHQALRIESLQKNVTSLQNILGTLSNQLKEKDVTISDLEQTLGSTQLELESLRPLEKSYKVVGVRNDGSGLVIPVEAKIARGDGSVSVNIKNVDLLPGTQASIRVAADVASDFTGIDMSAKDVTITFVNNLAETITLDGPSAGSVITILMIAALQNRTIDDNVLMTGTIESDGSVGKVGSVPDKVRAAKEFGARKFLVPVGQLTTVDGIEVVEVENIGQVVDRVLQ